jgi:predicted membrane-bound mannosyltransferase
MKGARWLLVGALAAGVLLRLPQLGMRPMHTDEAVHAIKFGALLETGTYRYDKNEYHGPTLNYLTLLPAWLLSRRLSAKSAKSHSVVCRSALVLGSFFFPCCSGISGGSLSLR